MNYLRWTRRPGWKLLVVLIAAAFLGGGCSGLGRLAQSSHEDLMVQYQAAVDDAETARPDEVFTGLQAVVDSNGGLHWQGDVGQSPVLAVTWTDWSGYDGKVGESMILGRDVWVTLVPELHRACRKLPQRHPKGVSRRLEQLLGLPPDDGRSRFVEIWVESEDLFRPCPDPEISDRECELDFPVSAYSQLNPHYATWFENLIETTYGDGGYPWTRLGYTYDWGDSPRGEVGLSELIIRQGADVTVAAVYEDLEYCRTQRREPATASAEDQ